jgi:hypothetical protein
MNTLKEEMLGEGIRKNGVEASYRCLVREVPKGENQKRKKEGR